MSTSAWRILRFGSFEADVRAGELHKRATRSAFKISPFRFSSCFWNDLGNWSHARRFTRSFGQPIPSLTSTTVLTMPSNRLREALGDSAGTPRFIETLPRKGYRFIGQVSIDATTEQVAEPAATLAVVVAPAQSFVVEEVPTAETATDEMIRADRRFVSRLHVVSVGFEPSWRGRIRLWQLAGAAVALLALGVGIAWWLRPIAPREVTAQRITANPADTPVTGAAISPDGKYVAYSDPDGCVHPAHRQRRDEAAGPAQGV